jgi:RNA polymerase sigma-70 factor (sigma-E family)
MEPRRTVRRPGSVDGTAVSERIDERVHVDSSRLGTLYRRHAPGAVRLAYLLTGDPALAEDLVQDAFVKLAGRLAHLRDPEAFEAYLRRTVVNLANSHFRRRKVERTYLERVGHQPDSIETPGVEDREELWQALHRLAPRQRSAIVLRFYEDLSEERTAEVLRCRPGTVKSLVSRGLEALRTEIGR